MLLAVVVDGLQQVLDMYTYRLDLLKLMPNQSPGLIRYVEARCAPALSQAPISSSRVRSVLAAYTAQRTTAILWQVITEAPQPPVNQAEGAPIEGDATRACPQTGAASRQAQ